jgi:hypothetical protein
MRKVARLLGLIWIALAAVGVALLWARYASIYYTPGGLRSWPMVALLFFAILPGIILYRWGRGPYVAPTPMWEVMAKLYPYKPPRVMRIKDGPDA